MPAALIDHTSLHAIRQRTLTHRQRAGAALELMHFAEHVLIADRLALSSAESEDTASVSGDLLASCARVGLADSANACPPAFAGNITRP